MQVEGNKMDDLDYIAELGFNQVKVSDADLNELKGKIAKRSFSYNSGFYFGFISLIVGVFIGVSVFFAMDNEPKKVISNIDSYELVNNETPSQNTTSAYQTLDTLSITSENFINPVARSVKKTTDTNHIPEVKNPEVAITIPSKPVSSLINLDKNIAEKKIKYIANAPVVYIHNLKVTDYTLLYFNKNQYIKLPGKGSLPVSLANKDVLSKNKRELKESANYYLHEELSEALLLFSKQEHGACIYVLGNITRFNKDDVNCSFYTAMSYYHTKNYTKAIEFFNTCIESSNNTFLQEATYYSAISLYESGDKVSAIEKLKIIVEEGEFYSEKAKAYLNN